MILRVFWAVWVWGFYHQIWDIEGQQPGKQCPLSNSPPSVSFPDSLGFLSTVGHGEASSLARTMRAGGPLQAPAPKVPASGEQALGHLCKKTHLSSTCWEAELRTCGLGRVILIIFISQSWKKKSLILLQFGKEPQIHTTTDREGPLATARFLWDVALEVLCIVLCSGISVL
jgi:hypothetical protein